MKKMKRNIPNFKNEEEEREFWATHSPLDYFDSKKFKKGSFPNLKPSLKSISIRLPEDLLIELKTLANKKDVPYQSLAKMFLAKQIVLERQSLGSAFRRRKEKVAAGLDKGRRLTFPPTPCIRVSAHRQARSPRS